MASKQIPQTIIVCLAALCLHLTRPTGVHAQAWVPAKGDGFASLTYQYLQARYHLNFLGQRVNPGRIRTDTTVIGLEYGITDRLALNADLAYVSSRYKGKSPESSIDNGAYHPTLQDSHIDLRYNAIKKPLVVTPFIGVTLPSHNYKTLGHSAVGRDLHELLVGVNVGRELGPILPNVYAHVRYSYAMLNHLAGLNLNRSIADWEVGWSTTRSLSLRFLGAWQNTYGGLDFGKPHTPEEHQNHDRAARARYIRLGGGVTFSVKRSFDIHTAYATTVSGINTHTLGGIAIGISWRFYRGLTLTGASADTSPRQLPALGQAAY